MIVDRRNRKSTHAARYGSVPLYPVALFNERRRSLLSRIEWTETRLGIGEHQPGTLEL